MMRVLDLHQSPNTHVSALALRPQQDVFVMSPLAWWEKLFSLHRPQSVPVLNKSNLAQIYFQRCSLQKSLFAFLLAVTQPHDVLVAQNCKCSVLNYCYSFN